MSVETEIDEVNVGWKGEACGCDGRVHVRDVGLISE